MSWVGERPVETSLRDRATRNFANGILWQADPDCIVLRTASTSSRITSSRVWHSGGPVRRVAMTSDHLGELSPERRALWSYILGDGNAGRCDFPLLGRTAEFGPLIAQIRRGGPGEEGLLFLFNPGEAGGNWQVPLRELGLSEGTQLVEWRAERVAPVSESFLPIALEPHRWRLYRLMPSSPA